MPPKPPVKQYMQSLECNWYVKKFVHITMSLFAKTAVYGSTLGRFRFHGRSEVSYFFCPLSLRVIFHFFFSYLSFFFLFFFQLLQKSQPQTRKPNGLLTISNHSTYIDDPLLWAAGLPMSCSTTGCQRFLFLYSSPFFLFSFSSLLHKYLFPLETSPLKTTKTTQTTKIAILLLLKKSVSQTTSSNPTSPMAKESVL